MLTRKKEQKSGRKLNEVVKIRIKGVNLPLASYISIPCVFSCLAQFLRIMETKDIQS